MQFGRKQIYTDVMQITKDNVVKVLRDALVIHEQNRSDIKFLLDYERGLQPIDERIKEIRPEINIKVKDNMAAEITEFKLGYEWGSPIRYVQRANKGIRENNKDADNVGIAMLNEMMEEENKPSADQELARFIEICGVGYRLIKAKPDQYRFGSSVVDILTLNPMNTFIVYTNDVYRRPIMGVSYITDQNGNSTYGCYTEDTYFEVKNISKIKGESKRGKNRLNGLQMKLESEIEKSKSVLKVLYGNKEDIAGTISAYEKERLEALDEWKKINAECYFDDSVYDEKDDLCPTCHQKLPDEQIANKHQMFEAAKKERKQKWQADHEDRLERIIKNGKHYQSLITSMKEKQESNVWEISEEEKNLHAREDELVKIENDIAALPDHVDLSGNKEYQHLVSEIAEKEKALQQINSGAEMRQQLKIRKTGLKDELAIVEKQIMAADNGDKEERIEQLEAEMREIAQNVADEEKMLYLLEQFMKAKMMIISKMVNEKFGIVSWKLFDKQVNGAVVECCECTYKGVGINKDLNNGHRVVAGLDIIRTLSGLHNVYAPIFVDNAEAVNDFNYPGMETQMILLKVSEDDELKVEREEM